jgi:hypothetical protein
MAADQIIIVIANGLISLGQFFLLKNFIPSYFNQKGKNLATKEDIGAITKIVESVKLDNSTQLEVIKTELGLVSKTQEIIYDDERKSIVEFMGTITDFYESNIDIPNESDTPEGLSYFIEKIRTLEIHYSKVQIARSNLLLFCDNKGIIDATVPILIDLAVIKGNTQVQRFKVLGSKKLSSIMRDTYVKFPTEENLQQYKDEIDKQTQFHNEFEDMKLAFQQDYYPKYKALLELCKVYLRTKKALH